MMTTATDLAPRTRLRLTVRGRRVLAALAAVPVVAGLAVAILGGGTALASREDGAPAGSFETVTVLSGESLWGIAQQIAPGHDPRDVVDAIAHLNRIDAGRIVAGQELAIPSEYTSH